jgi:hypothetical protein
MSAFLIAENGGKTITAARRCVRPEVTSPFDSLTPFGIDRLWNFSSCLSPLKSYLVFSICMQNSLRKFWGRGNAPENFFIDETTKGFSLSQTASFEVERRNRLARSGGGS